MLMNNAFDRAQFRFNGDLEVEKPRGNDGFGGMHVDFLLDKRNGQLFIVRKNGFDFFKEIGKIEGIF